ncbi:MAG: hypothetical protein Q7J73_01945 [Dehalococcoidales bacterium]|nr:hypothetical protein [Dehalococcoidales bacterium]
MAKKISGIDTELNSMSGSPRPSPMPFTDFQAKQSFPKPPSPPKATVATPVLPKPPLPPKATLPPAPVVTKAHARTGRLVNGVWVSDELPKPPLPPDQGPFENFLNTLQGIQGGMSKFARDNPMPLRDIVGGLAQGVVEKFGPEAAQNVFPNPPSNLSTMIGRVGAGFIPPYPELDVNAAASAIHKNPLSLESLMYSIGAMGPQEALLQDIALGQAVPAARQAVQGVKGYPQKLVDTAPRLVPERVTLGASAPIEKGFAASAKRIANLEKLPKTLAREELLGKARAENNLAEQLKFAQDNKRDLGYTMEWANEEMMKSASEFPGYTDNEIAAYQSAMADFVAQVEPTLKKVGPEAFNNPAEIEGLRAFLQNDPVATYQVGIGKQRTSLSSLLGSTGQWPETLTVNQATALKMGKPINPSSVVKGRIPWAYVTDEMADHFGLSESDFIRQLENIRLARNRLSELEGQATAARYVPSAAKPVSDVAPGVTVQTGLPGMGVQKAQAQMFAESGASGVKDTLVDTEALITKQKAKPLPGQADFLPARPSAPAVPSAAGKEPNTRTLWHGSRETVQESQQGSVFSWSTPHKGYASEYGTPQQRQVRLGNILDMRKEVIKPGETFEAERPISEWVAILNRKGVPAQVTDSSRADEVVKFWDLLHGADVDATKATNLAEAFQNSSYDSIATWERGSNNERYLAYGTLRNPGLTPKVPLDKGLRTTEQDILARLSEAPQVPVTEAVPPVTAPVAADLPRLPVEPPVGGTGGTVPPSASNMTLEQSDDAIRRFSAYLADPKSETAWQETQKLRTIVRQQRVSALQDHLNTLLDKGTATEDAVNQAVRDHMSGTLPGAKGFSEVYADQMREALFAKVYHTLQGDPFELMSTSDALTNALLGKAIPRDLGTKGGSAYTRLMRVFGQEPSVMEVLQKAKPLRNQIDDARLAGPVGSVEWIDYPPNVPFGKPRLGEKGWTSLGLDPSSMTPAERSKQMLELRLYLSEQEQFFKAKAIRPELTWDGWVKERNLSPTWVDYPPEPILAEGQRPLPGMEEAGWKLPDITQPESTLDLKLDLSEQGQFLAAQGKRPGLTFDTWKAEQGQMSLFEPTIEGALKELQLIPRREKSILVRGLKEAGLTVIDIGNFMRANKATLDNSWKRQNMALLGRDGKAFWNAEVKSWQAMFSTEVAEKSWQDITKSPLYAIYDNNASDFLRPLHLPKGASAARGVEEYGFLQTDRPIPRFAAKLPHIKYPQQAFVTGINEHLWALYGIHFKKMLKINERIAAGKIKLRPGEAFSIEKEMKAYGTFLEEMSGRAKLGPLKELGPALSAGLFSPRFKIGRIISPRHLWSSNKYVRQEAWRDFATFAVGISAAEMVGERFGLWEVGKDPRSSSFGKMRIGNTWIDPWGGFQQLFRFSAQIVTGQGTSAETGAPYPLDRLNSMARLLRGMLSPAAGLAADIGSGKTFIGEKLDWMNPKQWAERILPISATSAVEAFSTSGPVVGGIATILGTEGVGGYSTPTTALFSSWNKDFKAFNAIPSDDAKQKSLNLPTRESYRKANPEIEAKLFIIGQVSSVTQRAKLVGESVASSYASDYVEQLVRDNKIDPMTISGVERVLADRKKIDAINADPKTVKKQVYSNNATTVLVDSLMASQGITRPNKLPPAPYQNTQQYPQSTRGPSFLPPAPKVPAGVR